jgi:CDP-6-deoxy-D-xylo-4-hexulose-3-dehydrase
MFEDTYEKKARQQILEMAAEYCERFHKSKPYIQGQRIPYASRVFDKIELTNLVDSALDFWLTAGRYFITS